MTVTYDVRDTVTSCSYTTLPDNSARRRLCPTRGVGIPPCWSVEDLHRPAAPLPHNTRDSSCFSVYFAVWAAYCRGTEDLVYRGYGLRRPCSLFRVRRP